MKANPVIAIFLGSLILVNILHNIIPHHHHLDDVYSHNDCEQHDAGSHEEDQACEPWEASQHCHAFNGLEYVIYFGKSIGKEDLTTTNIIFLASVIFSFEPLPREISFDSFSGPPPDFKGFMGESAGLRAPPILS